MMTLDDILANIGRFQVDVHFNTNFKNPIINISKDEIIELAKTCTIFKLVFTHANGQITDDVYSSINDQLGVDQAIIDHINETIDIDMVAAQLHKSHGTQSITCLYKSGTLYECLDEPFLNKKFGFGDIDQNIYKHLLETKQPFVLSFKTELYSGMHREEFVGIRYSESGEIDIRFHPYGWFDYEVANDFERNQIKMAKILDIV